MNIKTRAEFCELTGITNAHITMYAKRGKIVLTKDRKHLDIDIVENANFIQHQALKGLEAVKQLKAERETETIKPTTETIKKETETKKQTVKSPKKKNTENSQGLNGYGSKWELELEKMRAEIDKKYIDTKVAEERLNVLKGNNIPIDNVKTIVAMLAHSMITNYKNFQEQHISDICHEFRISETDRAKINKKAVSGLNAIHRKAVSDTKKQLRVSIGTARSKEEQNEEIDD